MGVCTSRDSGDEDGGVCWRRSAEQNGKHGSLDEEECRVAQERDNVLQFMDEEDEGVRRQFTHFFSMRELTDLEEFRMMQLREDVGRRVHRSHTLVGEGHGPWGIASEVGGDCNSFDEIDGAQYQVRGANYLSDKVKVPSQENLTELLVVDLFMSETDIPSVASCKAAGTLRRLRRDGERRELVMLTFRVVPLHIVAVWAVRPFMRDNKDNSARLLARFLDDMSTEERNKRLKVIPRILQGPWPVRKLIGENCPAILGKNIPVSYYSDVRERVTEISINIAMSASVQRISRVMLRAGSAISVELAFLVEGIQEDELPEKIMGGFKIAHAELSMVRTIDPDEPVEESPERPKGLPAV